MSKITQSARGEDCQVRSPHCNFNTETTVFAHLGGGGMGSKRPDTEGAFCCAACHDLLDGRVNSLIDRRELLLMHHEGAMRTRAILIEKGLLVLK